MSKKDKVKKFWQGRASAKVQDKIVTHKDVWQRFLEIEMIKKFLDENDVVLDVGCGNGYTTYKIAGLISKIIGIDYSDEMINRARKEGYLRKERKNNISFEVKDILNLKPSDFGLFDTVISERCLINLSSWTDQKKAIVNISSVLKPGGRFIFVEGCKDGRDNLNKMRKKYVLKKMPIVWHNIDFKKKQTLAFLKRFFKIEHELHFGVYDFLARIVHPMLVQPAEPKYDVLINKIGAELSLDCQDFGKISRMLFLVMKKLD